MASLDAAIRHGIGVDGGLMSSTAFTATTTMLATTTTSTQTWNKVDDAPMAMAATMAVALKHNATTTTTEDDNDGGHQDDVGDYYSLLLTSTTTATATTNTRVLNRKKHYSSYSVRKPVKKVQKPPSLLLESFSPPLASVSDCRHRMTANGNGASGGSHQPSVVHKKSNGHIDGDADDEDDDHRQHHRQNTNNHSSRRKHRSKSSSSSSSTKSKRRMTQPPTGPVHNAIVPTSIIPSSDIMMMNRVMNLRNRPLKAATAGMDSNDVASPASASALPSHHISSTGSGDVPKDQTLSNLKSPVPTARRRSKRHQPTAATASAEPNATQASQSEASLPPVSPASRSIRSFFPLRTIGAVCELFRSQLGPPSTAMDDGDETIRTEPDLALLSIVIGIVETSLTRGLYEDDDTVTATAVTTNTTVDENQNNKDTIDDCHHQTATATAIPPQNSAGSYSPAEATPAPIVPVVSNVIHTPLDIPIPTVYYENVESLLKKFATHIKESIDLSKYPKKTTRELIKKISEVIWSNLHRSHYKDRAHLQTIYTYITDNKLDCYGVAYTVLAACQILGLDDVRLVMSEDHAWVIFGDGETCEVTWHGKLGEDRCGQPIPEDNNCWLYLNGYTMTCDGFQTVATLVSAMNLSINATQDSEELAILQQQLLWILYDYGHLQKYPMALGNLGDLEDVCVNGISKRNPIELFHEAIESAKKYYNDYHVYPYTYVGGYHFRSGRFKEAFKSWADAAQVIKKYNYTRDDEEIYKEFQEIANDLIPYIVKYSSTNTNEPNNVLQDPECFAHLLRFYDGLCAWEEDSPTPVLHIGWTKPIVSTISKFPYATRSKLAIKVDHHLGEKTLTSDNEDDDSENHAMRERRRRRAASISSGGSSIPLEKISDNVSKENGKNIPLGKSEEPYPESNEKTILNKKIRRTLDAKPEDEEKKDDKAFQTIFYSQKFSGIRNLLTADKLNTSAIQLQLTAQSQVNINKRNRNVAAKPSGIFPELDFVSTTNTTLIRTNALPIANNNNNSGNQNNNGNHKRFRRD